MPKAKKKIQYNRPVYIDSKRKSIKTTDETGQERESNISKDIVTVLITEYSKNANKVKAVEMKKYMRGKFEFFGLQSTPRRDIDKRVRFNFS